MTSLGDRSRVSYKNRHGDQISLTDLSRSSVLFFEHCDNCSITLDSKIARLVIQDCRNIKLSIKRSLVCGIDILDSADISVNDNPDIFQFSISVYDCSAVAFDTYGKYQIAVELSKNIQMNNTELAIDDYVLWQC